MLPSHLLLLLRFPSSHFPRGVPHENSVCVFFVGAVMGYVVFASAWGARSLLSKGYRNLLPPGVKRLGREAVDSPPYNAEVNNSWSYTSTLPIRLHDVVLN